MVNRSIASVISAQPNFFLLNQWAGVLSQHLHQIEEDPDIRSPRSEFGGNKRPKQAGDQFLPVPNPICFISINGLVSSLSVLTESSNTQTFVAQDYIRPSPKQARDQFLPVPSPTCLISINGLVSSLSVLTAALMCSI